MVSHCFRNGEVFHLPRGRARRRREQKRPRSERRVDVAQGLKGQGHHTCWAVGREHSGPDRDPGRMGAL